MEKANSVSSGLSFIKAASAAMPKSMGDREYIHAMDEVMKVAVSNRVQFASTDGPALARFKHDTCVGIFNPLALNWYSVACVTGGTYPAMWEKQNQMRPWKAPFVVRRWYPSGARNQQLAILENNRVCPGLGVVLPMAIEDDPEHQLDRFDNFPLDGSYAPDGRTLSGQVWWVTSAEDSHLILCRYQPGVQTPVRRKKVLRAEWASLVSQ